MQDEGWGSIPLSNLWELFYLGLGYLYYVFSNAMLMHSRYGSGKLNIFSFIGVNSHPYDTRFLASLIGWICTFYSSRIFFFFSAVTVWNLVDTYAKSLHIFMQNNNNEVFSSILSQTVWQLQVALIDFIDFIIMVLNNLKCS